jgi:high-affinity iron transporter
MPPFAASMSPQDRWNVVNYVYSMRGVKMEIPAAQVDASAAPGAPAARSVLALLDSALEFAKKGKSAEAGDRAFDAYIAFEPLETPARARQPGLVASMERHFADFKGALRGKDLSIAQRARDAIALDLPRVVELTRPTGSGWGAFFQSFLIILREGFEAILVIGAVVAFLIKTGNRDRLKSIWTGIALGLGASALMVIVLKTVFAHLPTSREVVEGITMLAAVVVLFSVSYWLISKVEAAKWQKFIREKVSTALDHGGGKALAVVAFLAVFREGAETALFYQALFSEGNVAVPLSLGILVGFAALAVIFTLFYRFGVRIPMRPFFTVTSVLLYYMAFVFVGKGIRELQEGNVVGITVMKGMPSMPSLGIFPSMETLVAQGILLALFVFMLVKTFVPARSADSTSPPSR